MDRHLSLLGERIEDGREGLAAVDGDALSGELLVDRGLGRRSASASLTLEAVAVLGQILPILRGWKLDRPDERSARAVDVDHRLDEAVLLVSGDRLLRVEAADHSALGEELADNRIVGGELGGFLCQRLGLGVAALVDHRVVFVHDHRQTLVDLDLLGPLAIDLRLDLGVLLVEGDLGGTLAGHLLDLATGAIDALRELGAGLGGDVGGSHIGGSGIEELEGLRSRSLGRPAGFELAGCYLGREAGDDQVAGEVGLPSGSSLSLNGRRGLTLGRRTTQRFFDDAAGIGGAGAASLLLGSGDVCGGNGQRFHGIVGDESPGGGKDRQGHPRQPGPAGGRGLVTDRLRARRWPTGAGCSVDVAKACHGHDPRGWENREGGIGTGPGGNGSRASIAAKNEVFGP